MKLFLVIANLALALFLMLFSSLIHKEIAIKNHRELRSLEAADVISEEKAEVYLREEIETNSNNPMAHIAALLSGRDVIDRYLILPAIVVLLANALIIGIFWKRGESPTIRDRQPG